MESPAPVANDDGKDPGAGDAWTWVAIDADTKLVPSWRIGDRSTETACDFVADLASRLRNRVQITSDGYRNVSARGQVGAGRD